MGKTLNKSYINNLETGRIELHFEKEDYKNLPNSQKNEVRRGYLWSRGANAWISRSTKNHYRAIQTAKRLGFTEEIRQGERLSYEEEIQLKSSKAERRADRYEYKAEKAIEKGKGLQSEFNSLRSDISFLTQPIISGHSGSQAFAKRREKIFNRYGKGFEEYKKSEYYKDRAEIARDTAEMKKFNDPVYVNNRIEECNSNIRKLEGNIVAYEDILYKKEQGEVISKDFYNEASIEQVEKWLTDALDKMEYEIDKLAYLENCMEEIKKILEANGKKLYIRDDIKKGYLIKVRGSWAKVLKVNPKTVEGDYVEQHSKGCYCLYPYAEIQDMKIPEGWSEEGNELKNPYKVGDFVTRSNISGDRMIYAYQVIKVTAKTITIQQVEIKDNKPVKDNFISEKQERRTIKQTRQGQIIVNDGDWYLYKYSA